MTVNEWLDDQIKQSKVHPDYKSIYKWIISNYNANLKVSDNGQVEKASRVQGGATVNSKKRGNTPRKRRSDFGKRKPKSLASDQESEPKIKEG